MATPLKQPGNAPQGAFFQNALANRAALVPGAAMLVGYANRRLGQGAAQQYTSLVQSSRANGAGPAIPPIAAPFSFTSFATGIRTLKAAGAKRLKGK